MKRAPRQQTGMALIAALFLIVVLASLGLLALRLNHSQQQMTNLLLLGQRADAAAQTGVEYAAYRALTAGSCPAATVLNLNQAALTGFVLNVRCTASGGHVVNGTAYTIYFVAADASRGAYGTPDYVWRSASRTVSAIP